MLGFDRPRSSITEDRHHIQEIFESAIAVLTGTEHPTNSVSERVSFEFGVLKHFSHRYFGIPVVTDFFRSQSFELLMSTV